MVKLISLTHSVKVITNFELVQSMDKAKAVHKMLVRLNYGVSEHFPQSQIKTKEKVFFEMRFFGGGTKIICEKVLTKRYKNRKKYLKSIKHI